MTKQAPKAKKEIEKKVAEVKPVEKKQEKTTVEGREFVGKVVSTTMKDTIIVVIERFIMHPIYGKTVRKTKRFSVHAPGATVKNGETVTIQEVRPISKTKHFILKQSS